ncbi:MAG: nucleotidyltransferase family protein [Candidatus Omnitrophica bacterium]|nr:nucleotidyltransferase family protein [Candidatus Omnitrophota bacterium]
MVPYRKDLTEKLLMFIMKHDARDLISADALEHTDWSTFLPFVRYHGLHSMLYPLLKPFREHIPHVHYASFHKSYFQAIAFNVRAKGSFMKIKDLFDGNGIQLVPLKGMALIFDIYSSHPSRPMCDLDILITDSDYERAKDLLKQIGYIKNVSDDSEHYWRNEQMHVSFGPRDGTLPLCILEMHWQLDYTRKYPLLSDLWHRVRTIPDEGDEIVTLSPEDTLFSLALHQRRFGAPLQLKYAFDTALLFKKYENSIDIDYLISEGRRSRIRSALYALVKQCSFFYSDTSVERLLKELHISTLRKNCLDAMIKKNTFEIQNNTKQLFATLHLFLFDSWNEPLFYMLNIPYVQFCKYYGLLPGQKYSRFLYSLRYFYYGIGLIQLGVQKLCFLLRGEAEKR